MIEVSQLTKRYGSRTAIDNLNFKINEGEIVGFLGPNAAGKTTTMKILTGFMPASEGTAQVAGYDVFTHPIDVKRNVGYLPENPPVYNEMKVREYIRFAARLHQVPKPALSEAVDQAIQKVGLKDVQGRLIGNLSKGYRQRVGLAQALVHNPKILILDEPTVGLDPKQIIEIRELIKSLGGSHTVILSSHILPEVTATCQRIIIINKGKIVAQDSLAQLSSRMQQGMTYALHVKNPDPNGVNALRAMTCVQSLNVEGNIIKIQLNNQHLDTRDQIIEAAVHNRMGVMEFSTEKVSLEDVFLQLTTEESMEAHS